MFLWVRLAFVLLVPGNPHPKQTFKPLMRLTELQRECCFGNRGLPYLAREIPNIFFIKTIANSENE
jgi:hypothetical protein